MVVADVLQRTRNTGNKIFLPNDSHGELPKILTSSRVKELTEHADADGEQKNEFVALWAGSNYYAIAMPRSENVFFKLVTDENSTTELLCNLLRFPGFRIPFLELFLPARIAGEVKWEDFDTQVRLPEHGCPDLQIRNESVLALLEVKVRRGLAPTNYQMTGYFDYLASDRSNIHDRFLFFLVPKNWEYRDFLSQSLRSRVDMSSTAGIQTGIIFWEQVIEVLEAIDPVVPNEFLHEFNALLIARIAPKPVTFSEIEANMLFSGEIPQLLAKLQLIVNEVRDRSTYAVHPSGSRSLCPSEYGVYFRGAQDQPRLWFGVWTDFWIQYGKPLCFGVDKKWGESVRQTFLDAYGGPTKPCGNYILGWFEESVLTSADATDQIWNRLVPLVEATISSNAVPAASADAESVQ
jgi:hypothetical protein